METISHTEFLRNMSAIIARVQAGEEIVLTYQGELAARLRPVQPEDLRKRGEQENEKTR